MEVLAQEQELDKHIADASARIERRMGDVAQQTVDAAKELGLMDALGKIYQEAQAKSMSIAWIDAKAMIAAGASLAPLAGTLPGLAKTAEAAKGLSAAGKAASTTKEATKAAQTAFQAAQTAGIAEKIAAAKKIVVDIGGKHALAQAEKATAAAKLWEAAKSIPGHAGRHMVEPGVAMRDIAGKGLGLAKDAVVNRTAVEGSKQALKEAVKKGAPAIGIRGLEWAMRTFDPFPDVPPALVGVAGVASLLLPGADIVPAVWQLIHNKVKSVEVIGRMVLDMGEVVANRLNRDYIQVMQPEVTRAAAAFPVPAAA